MGQLLRIIIVLVGLWLVLSLIKRFLSSRQKSQSNTPSIANMVACDYCGTHVPEPEAIRDGDKHFCSKEHQAQAHN